MANKATYKTKHNAPRRTEEANMRTAKFVTQDKDGNLLYENTQEFNNPDARFTTDEAIKSYGLSLNWILVSIDGVPA
jgi:hypothetical protein